MPVIAFCSPKGGAGKTTAATVLATELAERGARVTIIDADPNKNVVDWAKMPGVPVHLSVVGDVSEETIVDQIESAATQSTFVIVDLEGTASLMVSYATSMADFVVIPVQGSQLDAKQAARQMKLIKAQERIANRPIPFAVLFTRTNPAITPRTQRHIEKRFMELSVPMLKTRLYDREAFRAVFSYGGTIDGLADKGVSNLAAALKNARDFTAEVVGQLRSTRGEKAKEVA
jgi:chromosome partitioning protein